MIRFLRKRLNRRRERTEQDHRIGKFDITLSAGHMLPVYQRDNPQYDRFLPCLVKELPGGMVVDVGANVGDTIASLVDQNPDLSYIAIEADDAYFGYLQRNLAKIKETSPKTQITPIMALVGKTVKVGALQGDKGTAKAVLSDAEDQDTAIQTRTLDDIVQAEHGTDLALIKSDVDGFDFDVINSASGSIDAQGPLLYFECQCDTEDQYQAFLELLNRLSSQWDYTFSVFDNFGGVIVENADASTSISVLRYVQDQNDGTSKRTIYYCDILAYRENHTDIVTRALLRHRKRPVQDHA